MSTTYRPEDGLFAAILAAGMPVPNTTIKYGVGVTRWSDAKGKGDKPYRLTAHLLHNGHLAATFGNWQTGSRITYRSWENGHPEDPNEAQRLLAELARRQRIADEKADTNKASTAKRDSAIWELLPTKGDSAYLARKKVGAYGIRYGADHYGKFIAVPMLDVTGTFCAF